jgi:hypothetical protein
MDDAVPAPEPSVVAEADAAAESIRSDGTIGSTPAPTAQETARAVADEQREAMDPSWKEPTSDQDKPKDGSTPAEAPSAPQTEDGKWFSGKYKGNIDEAAKAYKASVDELNRVKAENDRLRAAPQPPPPTEEAAAPAPDEGREFLDYVATVPEVRHLDQKMVALKGEHKQQVELAQSVDAEINSLDGQIDELNEVLFASNDYEELAETRNKIRKLHQAKTQKRSLLDRAVSQISRIKSEYENADVSIRIAINGLKSSFDTRKAFEAHTRQRQTLEQKAQNRSVIEAIPVAAQKLAIPSDQMDDFKKFVIRNGNAFLSMHDDNGSPYVVEDWVEFFTEQGNEFKQMVDRLHRTQSGEYARKKTADATQNAPNGSAAIAPSDKTPTTERELDAWIKHQRL